MSRRKRRRLDPEARGLRGVQLWFRDQITGPGDGRLSIYREMYLLRIQQALAEDFPRLKRLLSGRRFGELCRDYIDAHPSTSFTLEAIDGAFPAFAARWTRLFPGERAAAIEAIFVDDVAKRLGQIPEQSALALQSIPDASDPRWAGARLVPIEALRVIRLVQGTRPRDLAVWRRGGAARRMVLSRPAAAFLRDLLDGIPLPAALERVTIEGEKAPVHVGRWLRRFVSAGFFARLEFS